MPDQVGHDAGGVGLLSIDYLSYLCVDIKHRLMKKFYAFLLAIVALVLLSGCSKGAQQEVEYYVKYASNGLRGNYYVGYADTDGEMVYLRNVSGTDFERTVGPVSKGFEASFAIRGDNTLPSVRIEVREGSGPFVVKAEAVAHSATSGASVKYTIK